MIKETICCFELTQKKVKNTLLEIEGSEILALWQAENLTKLSPAVLWKAQLITDELGYLAKEFPSKVLKMLPGFFSLLIVKCERTDKLRKELLNKMEPELDNFENFQPLQMVKDAESQKWLPKV